mgnify:CR=1 FL=1
MVGDRKSKACSDFYMYYHFRDQIPSYGGFSNTEYEEAYTPNTLRLEALKRAISKILDAEDESPYLVPRLYAN